MKDKVSLLIELQSFDDRIEEIRKRKEQGPLRIQALKDALDVAEKGFKEDLERLERLKKERRGIEQEIQDLENKVEKSSIKLFNIKSNKEYTAALKEIEDLKKIKFLTEDKALQAMEEIEEMEKKSLEHKKRQPELRGKYEKDKQEIENELIGLNKELENLEEKRNDLIQKIEQDLLKKYLLLRERKGGQAISPVIAGVCQTCHMGIPPQKFNELIRGHSLMACTNCGRIIYWGEDQHFQKTENVV